MTIQQAYQILDKVLANLQLIRADHQVLQQALGLLYSTAKDNQEEDNGGTNGKIVPIRPVT